MFQAWWKASPRLHYFLCFVMICHDLGTCIRGSRSDLILPTRDTLYLPSPECAVERTIMLLNTTVRIPKRKLWLG
ncbi:hypothetical protein HD806DRAFT_205309 [Xylariaceae sp. AK1471]|nr:hypothetical protein HD806DRAFT_205309 [Xylariaceae sp. AK1471]